jgi:TonB family protein
MSTAVENKNKITAIAFTIGFHALLFLLFIFMVFITPLPPFEIKPTPEIELDLGTEGMGNTDAGGSGQNDTHIETSTEAAAQPTHQTIPTASAPAIITDPSEEPSTYIPNNPASKNPTVTETPKIEEPKEDPRLLAMLQKAKDRKNQTGKGEGGNNTGGSGSGSEQGIGNGSGNGHGNGSPGGDNPGGNHYSLKGRKLIKKPDQMTDSQDEGTVVVEIIVDETGKVIRATPGQRGSTTASANLFAKARQAALSAKFDPSPEGIKEQRGTYRFDFVLE